MNKRPEITTKTREKLVNAFWQLYREKDVSDIRINEITDLAGYHRGTFYEYFTDIYDLLAQEEQGLVAKLKHSKDIIDSGEKPFFAEIIQFYRANGERVSQLIRHGNMSFINHLKESLYPLFLTENHLEDSGKTEVIYEFGVNGILMSLDYWYNHQDHLSLQEYLSTVQDVIQSGFLRSLGGISQMSGEKDC